MTTIDSVANGPHAAKSRRLSDLPYLSHNDRCDFLEDAEVMKDLTEEEIATALLRWEARRANGDELEHIAQALEADAVEARKGRADLAAVSEAAAEYIAFKPAAAISTIVAAYSTDTRLREGHLRILGIIVATTNGQSGLCWMNYDHISRLAGMEAKTARNRCSELVLFGYLARTDGRRRNEKGMRRTVDLALRPAGFDSWAGLRSAIDDWVRAVRRGRDAGRPMPPTAPTQGGTDTALNRGCSNGPELGPYRSTNGPGSGPSNDPYGPTRAVRPTHTIKSSTDSNSSIDSSFWTVTRGAPSACTGRSHLDEPEIEIIDSGKIQIEQPRAKAARAKIKREPFDPERHTSEAWRVAAREIGLIDAQIRPEFDKFRDHHTAKGSAMADWLSAWRNWCRRSIEYASSSSTRPRNIRPSIDEWRNA